MAQLKLQHRSSFKSSDFQGNLLENAPGVRFGGAVRDDDAVGDRAALNLPQVAIGGVVFIVPAGVDLVITRRAFACGAKTALGCFL